MKNVPSNLSNSKSKVDHLDVHKLVPFPVDLSKLSDVVKNNIVEKNVYNAWVKNIEDDILEIFNFATNASLNAKINEVKGEVPSITNSDTITVENKTANVSNLVKKLTITQKLVKLKIKLLLIMIMLNILVLLKNLISKH